MHVAARIGAAAGNAEILVSSAVLDAADAIRFGLSDARQITLKGVDEPVEVRGIDWR